MLTIKQAAEVLGKSKPTILRAIKNRKLAATKDAETGAWMIDPGELERVFKRSAFEAHRDAQDVVGALRLELAVMQERLADVRHERERERQDARAQVDDLARRLDASEEERRTTLRQLTALLADQREKPVTPAAPAAPEPAAVPLTAAAAKPLKLPPGVKAPVTAKPESWLRRMIGGR